ncbi:MAG TPA: YihY/virulence factor BrkB family protein, partial [Actinobacteria bacterium]|nr:YihY/virulence factor BrkB family protein [Actinomycetota bacterium]
HIVWSKLLSMAGVLAVILVLLLTTFLSVGYQTFQDYWANTFKATPPLAALGAVSTLGTLAITFFALVIIYAVIPNLKLRLRDVWTGALFATLAGELAQRGFALYASMAARFNAVYGSVGVIIGLMFWLYITAVILIFGAEINAARKMRIGQEVKNE